MITTQERITINEEVEFAADYFCLKLEELRESEELKVQPRTLCSFDGQFLKNRKPFEPPMRYCMANVGVITQDKRAILAPIYYSLLFEREAEKK